jgi:ubiquinone/menaquinone biosynthesis C-methylase UbiE
LKHEKRQHLLTNLSEFEDNYSPMNEDQYKIIIKETFNNVSCEYDSKALRFFSESAEYLASILRLDGHKSVIDIATGTGNAALAVAARLPQGNVTGVDFTPGMLEQARKKLLLRIP